MKIKIGSRRIVLIFRDFVIKIPNFTNFVAMIAGFRENQEERYWYISEATKDAPKYPRIRWEYKHLAEIYWADRFGFFVIMERLDTSKIDALGFDCDWGKVLPDDIQKDIYLLRGRFPHMKDIRSANIGYRGDEPVILDYGYFGNNDRYIGLKRTYGKNKF